MKLKSRWLQIGLADLKNIKQIDILHRIHFLQFFKNIAFSKLFENFWNSPVAHAKMVKQTLFYLNTAGQTL